MMLQRDRLGGNHHGNGQHNGYIHEPIPCAAPWVGSGRCAIPPHTPSRSRGGPLVPAGPFIAWLGAVADSHTARSNITGIRADEVARYLNPKTAPERVRLDIVDQAVTTADLTVDGLPFRLEDLYPYEGPLED